MKNGRESVEKAKQAAYRILAYRQRSCREIEEKLLEKGFSPETSAAVVGGLRRSGYLDDRKFARDYVEFKLSSSPAGRRYFEAELSRKHISSDIRREVLDEFFTGEKEYEIARELALKRLSRYSRTNEQARRGKIFSFLVRRGFPQGIAARITGSFNTEERREQPD